MPTHNRTRAVRNASCIRVVALALATACLLLTTAAGADAPLRPGDRVSITIGQSGASIVPLALPATQETLILHLEHSDIGEYELRGTGDGRVIAAGGNRYPASDRRFWHPEFLIAIPPGPPRPLELHLQARAGLPVTVSINNAITTSQNLTTKFLADGVYFGAMFLMLIFLLSLAVFLRDANSLRLAATLGVWIVAMATVQGYAALFFWPNAPALNSSGPWLIILASLFSTWFSRAFLTSNEHVQSGARLLAGVMALCFGALIAGLFTDAGPIAIWVLAISGTSVFGVSLFATLRGDTGAAFLLGAALMAAFPAVIAEILPWFGKVILTTGVASLVFVVLAVIHRFGERFRLSLVEGELAGARARFLANLSHEIRTPLNAIVGFAGLCAEADLQGEAKQLIDRVNRSARMLLALVNEILDFSRLEAGAVQVALEPTDVRAIVGDVFANVEAAAAENNVALSAHIAYSVPDLIEADPLRCTQVLLNLVGNAVKFTRDGQVSVTAYVEDATLVVSVSDNGIGIEATEVASLFDPFSQATRATSGQYGGSGLGLAISSDLAELLGGHIEVESEPGEGSVFTFHMPVDLAAEVEARASDVTTAASTGRVLLAEDNTVNQFVLRRMLEKQGQSVEIVDNGRDAVRRATNDEFDLVLMDVEMPVLDGVAATRSIRASPRGGQTPIVALTGHTSDADRERCLDAGVDGYLTKPVTASGLAGVLNRFIVATDPEHNRGGATEPDTTAVPMAPAQDRRQPHKSVTRD